MSRNLSLDTEVESSPFDEQEALLRLDGDEELLRELARIFLRESPEILQRLRDAVERGDPKAVAIEAHSMKGSVSNFAVNDATESALTIEKMGRENDLRSAPEALRRLEDNLELLRPALAHLGEEQDSSGRV
ncbi:MAG TPA: Hpt domain-containing protein [Terriglobia bacterium]|nr:Hpt domain-containing protein [Terriglobia bacterium]